MPDLNGQHDLFDGPAVDREECLWCGAEATHLCDAWAAQRAEPREDMPPPDAYTCDAPLCRDCARCLGQVFVRMTGQSNEVWTDDRCPAHTDVENDLRKAQDLQEFTDREIKEWRRHFYQRQRMEAVE